MKLKVIEQARKTTCDIRCSKTGLITFNNSSIEALSLEEGDKVDFLQDEDEPRDFYLKKMGGMLTLRPFCGRRKSSRLDVNNVSFVRAVAETYGIVPPFSMMVSEKPNDEGLYALIPVRQTLEG